MSCDLLATEGYGEIIGGGQREDSYEDLVRKIKEHGLDVKDFEWDLDLRRYGAFQSAGFGLGVERTVGWICGVPHVRETIPFPRLYGRNYP
jgi:asparaginyl-tRNA synthetase